MNLIKILNVLKYATVACFVVLHIVKRGKYIENIEIVKNVFLYELPSLLITIYLLIFLIPSRIELKDKDEQITALKIQLKN